MGRLRVNSNTHILRIQDTCAAVKKFASSSMVSSGMRLHVAMPRE
jgi:hypothetical protein